ncbi:MAG: hypothetical protein J6S00_01810 [Clostridia bacterium]|nr:hypothetical protein [Clostridia bacterium]
MNGKELKKLSRRELVEIIYQLKKNEQEMQEKMDAMQQEIEAKRIKLSAAGSIADAATSITELFATAQNSADIYLQEITAMKEDTAKECEQMIAEANQKVATILSQGQKQFADLRASYKLEYKKWQQLQIEIEEMQRKTTQNKCEG